MRNAPVFRFFVVKNKTMTLAHFNRGYGNNGIPCRRARSAHPILQVRTNSDSLTLDDIRQRAREVWSRPDSGKTSYQDHFHNRSEEVDEVTISRPTSPTRKNKPHPPLVFLNCRLNSVPGYHNADARLGKAIYKVDDSLPAEARYQRSKFRTKYVSQPSTTAVKQYKTDEYLQRFHDPIERQAMQALIKLNPDYVTDLQRNGLNQEVENDPRPKLVDYIPESPPPWREHPLIASHHRYMRMAGAEESQNISKLKSQTYSSLYPQPDRYHTIGSIRNENIHNMGHSNYVHKSKRGDFLMHPEWPPTISHHRLNGLSSVDIPYYPGRR